MPRRSDPLAGLPEEAKAHKDWEEICMTESPYKVLLEGEFMEATFQKRYIDSYVALADNITEALYTARGKAVNPIVRC